LISFATNFQQIETTIPRNCSDGDLVIRDAILFSITQVMRKRMETQIYGNCSDGDYIIRDAILFIITQIMRKRMETQISNREHMVSL